MIGAIHVHSSYSHDGRDSVAAIRDFAVARGLAFVGLTDHAEDFDEPTFIRFQHECRAASTASLAIIAGLEFRFAGLKGLHLLALGLERWITPETPAEFIAMTRGTAAVTVAAHPVLPRYSYPQVVLDSIDAIEVWNAAYNTRYLPDPRAIRLFRRIRAYRNDIVAVVGLDQHDARNDRETRIETSGAGDALVSIRAGQFRNIGRTMSFDSQADLGAVRNTALWTARTLFDGVERAQDRLARWRAHRSSPTPLQP